MKSTQKRGEPLNFRNYAALVEKHTEELPNASATTYIFELRTAISKLVDLAMQSPNLEDFNEIIITRLTDILINSNKLAEAVGSDLDEVAEYSIYRISMHKEQEKQEDSSPEAE